MWNFAAFLKAKYLRICPYGNQQLEKLIRECTRDVILISVLASVVVILWNGFFEEIAGAYVVECLLLTIYLVIMEVPNYKLRQTENRVELELLNYFSRVKHQYLSCHHISNAVLDAADGMSYEIQRLAGELYNVLMESERKEKVREYILYHRSNKFLKLFLVQAYETSDKGDIMLTEGNSLFSENVEYLRLELMEEVYRKRKQAHEFAGYTFVAVAPVFMMPLLKQWGLEFAPELGFFYAGTGHLIELITVCATVVIYGFISKAKDIALYSGSAGEKLWNTEFLYKNSYIESMVRWFEKAEGKISSFIREMLLLSGEFVTYGKVCLQMMVIACTTFFLLLGFILGTHARERQNVLHNVDSIETIAPVASEEKKIRLSEYILTVTGQCLDRTDITEAEIRSMLREKIRLANETMETAAVEEILNKLGQYRTARLSFWEAVVCILSSLFTGALPLVRLWLQVQTTKSGAVNEVRQFQSVIVMERKLRGVSIVGLLEDMEIFSVGFRGVLRKCINSYGGGPRDALLRLKEEGRLLHESFADLADAFLSVDDVGIAMAFAEVESNRRMLEKMTRLENEISMERKKDNTDLCSKIPMVLAVGIYFVLPFFLYSLRGVYEVFEVLEGMQM